MNLKNIHTVFFVGIGGIGMSAIARYFLSMQKQVIGYDKTATPLTDELIKLGAVIGFQDEESFLEKFNLKPQDTLLIYTPAIPKTNTILQSLCAKGHKAYKRAEVLGFITESTFCFAIAGTHGKTTTTSILGHLMQQSNQPATTFLGGISENYQSNLIQNGLKITVVEADEYDRSFLKLTPNYACITSIDADHLDIYKESSELSAAFDIFISKIQPEGKLFLKKGLPFSGITYGTEEGADYQARNIRIKNGIYCFDLKTPKTSLLGLKFKLPGTHNLSNATAALAMAIEYGCDPRALADALYTYKGVKRRFTYQIKTKDFVFIDDYAHHPQEINAAHDAIQQMYPNQKALVIFQPHLFSRTRDFADDFAHSLAKFDAVLLMDIYPAREEPIAGVDSKWLLDKIDIKHKALVNKSTIVAEIKRYNYPILITMGAGDIGSEVKRIKKELVYAS